MRIRKGGRLLLILLACVLLAAGGTVYAAEKSADRDTVAEGVFIGRIDVGGMTREEAQTAVESYIDTLKNAKLTLSFNGDETELSLAELGFTWENPDVVDEAAALGNEGNLLERYKALCSLKNDNVTFEIQYTWDEAILREFLQEEAHSRQAEPVEATIIRDRKNKEFIITESVTGITVDVASTMKKITEAVNGDWDGEDLTIEAVAEVVEPEFTTEMAYEIQDLLGEYSTPYNPAETDRSQNLVTGCGYINGVVLMPGEQLSFFDYLYPCTAARGYRVATAYQGGRYIDSVGGGLCQVSTTCYNAVLLAELEVVTRSPHSMTVSYVKPGLDSGQAWSSGRNLTFANNTDYPVYVEAYASGGTLYVGLWGKETRPANRTVRYGSDVTEEWIYNGETVYEYDPTMPYGEEKVLQGEYPKASGHAYKEVLIDGKVVSKEYLSDTIDTYRATPRYVAVGTGGLSKEEYLAGQQPAQEPQQPQPQQPQPPQPQPQPPTTEAPATPSTEAPTTAPTESAGTDPEQPSMTDPESAESSGESS